MVAVIKGGTCLLGCVDPNTGKPRSVLPHSITGICPTCLNALSRTRHKTAAWRIKRRSAINLGIARLEEVKEYPKGYAAIGGRKHGKRN